MADITVSPIADYREVLKRLLDLYGPWEGDLPLRPACQKTRSAAIENPSAVQDLGAVSLRAAGRDCLWTVPDDDPGLRKHTPLAWALNVLDFTIQLEESAELRVADL